MIAIRQQFNDLTLNYQLMVLITLLNLVDFQTTKVLVDRLGFAAEANALLFWAMVTTGTVYAILAVKVVVISFMWWIVSQIKDHHMHITPERLTLILQVLVVAFLAVASWNYFRIFQELNIT